MITSDKQNNKKRITFRDLDTWLKVAIITAWIELGIFVLSFAIGFVSALTSSL